MTKEKAKEIIDRFKNCVYLKEDVEQAIDFILKDTDKLDKLKEKLAKDIAWYKKEKEMIFYDINKLEQNNNTRHEYKFLYQQIEYIDIKEVFAKEILEVLNNE